MKQDVRELMNVYGANGVPFFFLIDFEKKQPTIFTKEAWEKEEIWFQLEEIEHKRNEIGLPETFELEKSQIPYSAYQEAFKYVKDEIGKGNSYLVNLTFSTPIQTNFNLKQLYAASEARYKLYYKDQFVCFSPETFVKIKDGIISTYPMKGTINADLPNAEARILADKKEFSEHVTVVDLLRNDLSMVGEKVRVPRFRYVEELKTSENALLQVSSQIEGKLNG